MKEAVRANLRQSLYASSFRPGGRGEGGDGVTVVRLRA
jgi:dsDNA-specific endonuclease/ATPase MutS2